MRWVLILATALPLLAAQDADKTAAASPVPVAEPWFTGSIDLGYSWLTGVRRKFRRLSQHRGPRLGAETLRD